MPTVNPRITITITPQTHAVLQRISALSGNSMSAIVGDLLEESHPVFERMVRLLDAAAKINHSAKEEKARISESLVEAHRTLEKSLGLSLDSTDETTSHLASKSGKLDRRSGRAKRSVDASTPLSNRGVRSRENPNKPVQKSSSSPALAVLPKGRKAGGLS